MFGPMRDEERIIQMSKTIDSAMADLNMILMNPNLIRDVKYSNEDGNNNVFSAESTHGVLKIEIHYDDTEGKIRTMKKEFLLNAEDKLLADLEKLKQEKARYE